MALPFDHPMRCAGCFEDIREMGVASEQTRVFRARYAFRDGKWRNTYAEYEGDIGEDTSYSCAGCDALLTAEQEMAVRVLSGRIKLMDAPLQYPDPLTHG